MGCTLSSADLFPISNKVTTMMLRNIPNKYTQNSLLQDAQHVQHGKKQHVGLLPAVSLGAGLSV
jgi:hypothetical protein